MAFDLASDETISRDVREWLRLFEGSDTVLCAIPVDEPHTAEQKQRARHIAEVVGRAGGKPPRLLRAVTDRASPAYAPMIDLFFAPKFENLTLHLVELCHFSAEFSILVPQFLYFRLVGRNLNPCGCCIVDSLIGGLATRRR